MNVSLTNEVTLSSSCSTVRCSDSAVGKYRDPSHLPSTLGNSNMSHRRYLLKQSQSRAEGLLEVPMNLRNRRLNKTERATLIRISALMP